MFGIVAVDRFQLRLPFHQMREPGLVLLSGGLLPLGPEVVPVMEHIKDIGQERGIQRRFGKFLLHIAQAAAFGQEDAAAVRGLHARQQAQQGGFARAVGPADAEPDPGIHLQREIAENVPAAKGLGKFLNRDLHSQPSRR